tara:strand:- start:1961 stop:2752 length:792 start_codon:yes stop_codon:yes gene_type:complete
VDIKEPRIIEPRITEPRIADPIVLEPPIVLPPSISTQLPFVLDPLVIDMPGCVETREDETGGSGHFDNDPDGVMILCDFSQPVFYPLDYYKKLEVIKTKQLAVTPREPEESKKQNTTTKQTKNFGGFPPPPPDCPPNGAAPINSIGKYGRGRITAYKIDSISGECIAVYEPIRIIETVDHFTPPPALVSGVMVTALFGATSALMAAPLTELIKKKTKPLQKKIIKAVKKKLGKKDKPLSRGEKIRAQREKNRVNLLWRSLLKK